MTSNRKIKIAQVVLNLDIGGLETLVVDMLKHLDKQRFDVAVFCLRHKGEMAQELESLGFRVYGLDGKDRLNWGAFLKLAGLLRKEKVDIVHCHNTAGYFYGGIAAILSGFKKIIYTEHGRIFPDTKRRMMIERILSWFAYRIVAVSQDMKRCLIEHEKINPNKVQVIYNGVDANKFKRTEDGGRRVEKRQKLGIGKDDVVIGNVARFDPVKDHECLIRAFAILKDKGLRIKDKVKASSFVHHPSSLKLLLVGDGEEFENSKQLCRDLGVVFFDFKSGGPDSIIRIPYSVLFLRARTDIPELMNIMDVFVLSSKNEGISLTLLEAMACGVPVVATRVGGNPEVIQKAGRGTLVESGDAEGLANTILRITENGTRSTENPSSVIRHPFSFEEMLKEYEELYV